MKLLKKLKIIQLILFQFWKDKGVMKAAIYNPYLDTLGGGEKYTITFTKVLAEAGYDVDIEWSNKDILDKLSNRFGLKIPKNIKVADCINRGENYDLCFWVSDGSVPTLRSYKNFIHFQVPFKNVNGKSLLNKMKLFRVNKIICNSSFTKEVIDAEFGVNSEVLYPPIDTSSFKSKRKENIIIYVGRFSNLLQSKGQEILIQEFKKLYDGGLKNWCLILAGGSEVGSDKIISLLNDLKDGYPIEIVKSPTFDYLKSLYGKAKIFWSTSGFGVDPKTEPQKVEHFGMTVVEAMSAGAVPIIVGIGGHKEIIDDEINGYLWQNIDELDEITKRIINTKGLISKVSAKASISSKKFDYEQFKKQVLQIIK